MIEYGPWNVALEELAKQELILVEGGWYERLIFTIYVVLSVQFSI